MGAVLELLDAFSASTVQNIKPWAAAPPKLRTPQPPPGEEQGVPTHIVSTPLSSQDGIDVSEPVSTATVTTASTISEGEASSVANGAVIDGGTDVAGSQGDRSSASPLEARDQADSTPHD